MYVRGNNNGPPKKARIKEESERRKNYWGEIERKKDRVKERGEREHTFSSRRERERKKKKESCPIVQ